MGLFDWGKGREWEWDWEWNGMGLGVNWDEEVWVMGLEVIWVFSDLVYFEKIILKGLD